MILRKWAIAFVMMLVPGSGYPQVRAQAPVTGILSAFGDEVTILEQELTGARSDTIQGIRFITGKLKGRNVVIASSGVGKVHAAMTATLLIDHFRPHEVLFTGIAGAVSAELHPGDIVIGEKAAQHDLGTLTPEGLRRRGVRNPVDWQPSPLLLNADPGLCTLATAAAGAVDFEKIETSEGVRAPKIMRGLIVTGDVFVASFAKKEELRRELGADAVEMEGAAVAQVCHLLRVPWLVIRSISDAADANASRDVSRFYPVAAGNSTRLVTEIVARLASPEIVIDRR
jgi:adenosylhomocysteine nucleosidase